MAGGSIPHFQNDAGHAAIDIGVKEFMCVGANPPFDHPHVFLDMGATTRRSAPIARRFIAIDPALKARRDARRTAASTSTGGLTRPRQPDMRTG